MRSPLEPRAWAFGLVACALIPYASQTEASDSACNALLGRLLLPIRLDEGQRLLARPLPADRDPAQEFARRPRVAGSDRDPHD